MPPQADQISSDRKLYTLVTQTQPFTSYVLFPRVDSVGSGTLNGSNAHRPLVRVRMNATAYGALQNDTLPSGDTFPDGSILLKEIIENGEVTLYAIMVRDRENPLAGAGRLWAELRPDGDVFYSITNRGEGCVGCHALEKGTTNDLVRTFERQNR